MCNLSVINDNARFSFVIEWKDGLHLLYLSHSHDGRPKFNVPALHRRLFFVLCTIYTISDVEMNQVFILQVSEYYIMGKHTAIKSNIAPKTLFLYMYIYIHIYIITILVQSFRHFCNFLNSQTTENDWRILVEYLLHRQIIFQDKASDLAYGRHWQLSHTLLYPLATCPQIFVYQPKEFLERIIRWIACNMYKK